LLEARRLKVQAEDRLLITALECTGFVYPAQSPMLKLEPRHTIK